jgi:hypothetical protein
MLMKLSRSIVRATNLHPLVATINDKIEEEVKKATVTFENMQQQCEDLSSIYENEDESSEIAIAFVRDWIAGYDSDSNGVAGDNR